MPPEPENHNTGADPRSGLRILIVDDRKENRYLLESLLGSEGFVTDSASNGIEALECLKNQPFDAIISDLLMPKMDGFQLIRECKKDPSLRTIPFIIYTATYTDAKDAEFGLSLGAARYIIKPAEPEAILRELNEVLGQRRDGTGDEPEVVIGDEDCVDRVYTQRIVAKLNKKILDLRKNEEKYRSIVENSGTGIVIIDRDGTYLMVNKLAADLLGAPADEIVGKTMFDFLPSETARHYVTLNRETLDSGTGREYEDTFELKTGKRTFYVIDRCLKDPDGKVISLQSSSVDITGRKRVEEALKESEKRYRLLTEASPEMIYLIDPLGYIQYVNPTAARAFHAEPDELTGKHLSDVFPPKITQNHLEALRQVVAERQVLHREIEEEFPTGRVYLDVRLTPVINEQDQVIGILGLSNDITLRKRAEEQQECLIRELARKNAELDRFTYTVSHDLKSPLVTLQGFIGLLEEDLHKDDNGEVQKDLDRLNSAAEKMDALITTLLDLSRSGRSVDTPVKIPFTDLCREAAGLLDALLKKRGVTLVIPDDLPQVYGDRQRLLQVMINLLDNAAKFMGNQEEPRVEAGVRTGTGGPVFFVQDNGMGIRPENQAKVFGLFERFNPEVPGTGIGLATVKRIIETHGGKIWVESEGEGKGTAFCFTLPGAGPIGAE